MAWTTEQQTAIDIRNKNILVAAAAGSGKTAVLVERVKQLVLSGEANIDEMLVVTFTNAAASEMKQKIIDAIRKELSDENGNKEFLKEQLNKVYSANISTFHAFAIEIIRRYFYIAEVEPLFKICDDSKAKLMQREAIDEVMDEAFSGTQKADFIKLLDCLSGAKNIEAVKQLLLNIYIQIRSMPNSLEVFKKMVDELQFDYNEFIKTKKCKMMLDDIEYSLKKAYQYNELAAKVLAEVGLVRLEKKIIDDGIVIQEIIKQAEQGKIAEVLTSVNGIKRASIRATKEEEADYKAVKDDFNKKRDLSKKYISKISDSYCYQSLNEHVEEIKSTHSVANTLYNLLVDFDEKYTTMKKDKGVIDFSDIEHYALKILDNDQAASEYREKFKAIFVDEYQDSNIIQETIISKISRDNNVFMVGDIKQSIYKFRLAEPEIFKQKYELYKKNTEKSIAIDLNKNFRSKKGVIETTNQHFKAIMENYDDAAALKKGVNYEGSLEYDTELHIVETKMEDVDDEIAELKAAEIEARFIAREIKNNVNTGMMIYNTKVSKDNQRKVSYRDNVILLRAVKSSTEAFRKAFEAEEVPLYVEEDNGYYNTTEIQQFVNLLKVIDNKRQDIPLISTLYSSIFGFSADELASIRIFANKTIREKVSFSEAFLLSCNADDCELNGKSKKVLETISRWKKFSKIMPLHDFMWLVMQESGFYLYVGALPGGLQRQANLRALLDKASSFAETDSGLFSFLNYVELLKTKEIPTGQVSIIGEGENVVKLMTIHKSKGLDYPIVFVGGLGRKFRNSTDNSKVSFHKDIGIGINLYNFEEKWRKKSLIQNIIAKKKHIEDMEEEIRILYVAYTRAIDKLVLFGTMRDVNTNLPLYRQRKIVDVYDAGSYFDMILPTALSQMKAVIHNPEELVSKAVDELKVKSGVKEELIKTRTEIRDSIRKKLEYRYPHEMESKQKSKYSVSEINSDRSLNVNIQLEIPKALSITKEKGLTHAEIGSLYHLLLEHIPFSCAGTGKEDITVEETISMLIEREFIFPEEAKEIKTDLVSKFLKSSIAMRMKTAEQKGKLYKELPFTLKTEVNGTEALVQGIIDCCFEEDGEYVLVDYKTNNMRNQGEAEQNRLIDTYKKQIEIYRKAISRIKGKNVKESYLYMIKEDLLIRV